MFKVSFFRLSAVIIGSFLVAVILMAMSEKSNLSYPKSQMNLNVDRCQQDSASFDQGLCSLIYLQSIVPSFQIRSLPSSKGEIILDKDHSLTINKIRGVSLDPDPPTIENPIKPYPAHVSDNFEPINEPYGKDAPYIAKNIKPFRFKYFRNEFNYGGLHTNRIQDYASAHGFSVLFANPGRFENISHLPDGTEWMKWMGVGLDGMNQIFKNLGLLGDRFELLSRLRDTSLKRAIDPLHQYDPKISSYMADLEYYNFVTSVQDLKKLPSFPIDTINEEQQQFIEDYFKGVELSFTTHVDRSRAKGFKRIGIYGWSPYLLNDFDPNIPPPNPETNEEWLLYGKKIYEAVDVIHPSVYLKHPSDRNVVYILGNLDRQKIYVDYMNSQGKPAKPIVPYFWNLFLGDNNREDWWKHLPITNEDARAMTAFSYFTGIHGLAFWGFYSHSNPHLVEFNQKDFSTDYYSVKQSFTLPSPDGKIAQLNLLQRYDVIKVIEIDEQNQTVKFQLVDKKQKSGIDPNSPTFNMNLEELQQYLRPSSEPISGLIEGLALVYPFEYLLRHGEIKVDINAEEQWQQELPIVRRIKKDGIHIIIAYNPQDINDTDFQLVEQRIVINNFDGVNGRNLVIPVDTKVRIYVLRENLTEENININSLSTHSDRKGLSLR